MKLPYSKAIALQSKDVHHTLAIILKKKDCSDEETEPVIKISITNRAVTQLKLVISSKETSKSN